MPTKGSGPTHEGSLEGSPTKFIGPTHEGPLEFPPSEFMGPTHEQDLIFSESTSSALVLGQSVVRTVEASVGNTLALSQGVANTGIIVRSIEQTINFTQKTNQIHILVGNTINFGQVVVERLPIINVSVENILNLLDVVRDGTFRESVSNSFAFSQALTLQQILSRSVGNTLSLEQQARTTIEESVGNTISFSGQVNTIQEPSNALILGQIVVAELTRIANNTLVLGQIVVVNVVYNRALGNTCAMSGAAVGKIFQLCLDAGLPAGSSISLSAAGATTLVLPNPEFGNSESLEVVRAVNTSRGGTINIVQDPIWPEETLLSFTVTTLSEAKKNEILDFVRDSLGKLITLIDQDNRTWQGIIENPQEVITSDDGICDRFAAEFNLTAVLT